jgi:ribosome-associated heat shock protein Hsp15
VVGGKVEVGGQDVKPSRVLKVGDVLKVRRGDELFEIEVRALSDVRGSAPVAQQLYRESEESIARRAAEREQRRLSATGYRPPLSKPDKRARRLIQALGDLDALD